MPGAMTLLWWATDIRGGSWEWRWQIRFIRLCLKPSVECDLPGRLRLRFGRFELLPKAALPYLHYIEDILGMLAGVREVRVNARIGTILILYDAQTTSSAAILRWVDAVVEEGLRMARERLARLWMKRNSSTWRAGG
ncbi:MAG: hypothetical protein V8Q67_06990 [Blautia massiliensis (ex Durand et al. 2017)]